MSSIDTGLASMFDLFPLDVANSPAVVDALLQRRPSLSIVPDTQAPILRNKAGKPRKLRASCDACSIAKVKCSKDHPICQRCLNNGSNCHYSPSMRLGKPRSKPKDPNVETASPAKSNAGVSKKARKRPEMFSPAQLSTSSLFSADNTGNQSALASFGVLDPSPCDLTLASELDSLLDPSIYAETLEDLDKSLHGQAAEFGDYFKLSDNTHASNFTQQSQSPFSLSLPALSDDSDDDLSSAFTSSVGTPTSARSSITDVSSPDTTLSPTRSKPHDCTAVAFSTLSELSTLSGAPFTNANEFDELVMLDALLTICQTGIDNVTTILDCPCSRHPHFSTTISFIITKVLSWYQTLSGLAQGLPPFGFDGEINSATTLRSQSIRWELRRIERIVDEFPTRFGTRSERGGDVDVGVYVHLQSLMRTKLRETLECTMPRSC